MCEQTTTTRPLKRQPKFIRCTSCGERKRANDQNFTRNYYKGERRGLRKVCRTCTNAQHAKWVAAHPEAVLRNRQSEGYKRSQQRYNAEHKAKINARAAAWKKAHPDKCAAASRNRRAQKQQAQGSHTTADVAAQRTRQKGRCYWCHEKVGRHYHVDHVVPLSKGGSNGPENIVVACAACNLAKKDRDPMDFGGCLF